MYFNLLWNESAVLSGVEAIALGGSRAGSHYDQNSDYDLYVYCTDPPGENMRSRILENYCRWYNMIWMEKIIGKHQERQDPVANYPGLNLITSRKQAH